MSSDERLPTEAMGALLGRLSEEIERSRLDIDRSVLDHVLSLAVELAREGREGRKVGTLFIVGDSERVLNASRPLILDPLAGHPQDARRIDEPDARATIKELAQLDGAFLVSGDGVALSAARYLDADSRGIELPLGLGARHMAGASVSRSTRALAVVVSESSVIRLFQGGDMIAEILPELWMLARHQVMLQGPYRQREGEDLAVFSRSSDEPGGDDG